MIKLTAKTKGEVLELGERIAEQNQDCSILINLNRNEIIVNARSLGLELLKLEEDYENCCWYVAREWHIPAKNVSSLVTFKELCLN